LQSHNTVIKISGTKHDRLQQIIQLRYLKLKLLFEHIFIIIVFTKSALLFLVSLI